MTEEPTDLRPEDFLPGPDQRQPPKPKKGFPLWLIGVFLIATGVWLPGVLANFRDLPENPTTAAERGAVAAPFLDFVMISGTGVLLCVFDFFRGKGKC